MTTDKIILHVVWFQTWFQCLNWRSTLRWNFLSKKTVLESRSGYFVLPKRNSTESIKRYTIRKRWLPRLYEVLRFWCGVLQHVWAYIRLWLRHTYPLRFHWTPLLSQRGWLFSQAVGLHPITGAHERYVVFDVWHLSCLANANTNVIKTITERDLQAFSWAWARRRVIAATRPCHHHHRLPGTQRVKDVWQKIKIKNLATFCLRINQ